jgi:hypothetical protein
VRRLIVRTTAAAFCVISLFGCVDSVGPILPDAQPLFGERVRFQFYTLSKGIADEPEQTSYKWNGARYVRTGGGMHDVRAFSVHPFEGNSYIVQGASAKRPRIAEYAVAFKLTDGVYQVIGIDEDDADAATRAAHCKKTDDSGCRIETREQLSAFARATAARRKGEGGLIIRSADGVQKPPHRR